MAQNLFHSWNQEKIRIQELPLTVLSFFCFFNAYLLKENSLISEKFELIVNEELIFNQILIFVVTCSGLTSLLRNNPPH